MLYRLTGDALYQDRYDDIVNWGREARANLDSSSEQYAGLISVWSEHAEMTPAPEVLDTLADLHIAGRDAVVGSSLYLVDSAPIASNMLDRFQCSSSPPPANTTWV